MFFCSARKKEARERYKTAFELEAMEEITKNKFDNMKEYSVMLKT